ncbi:aaa atpase domain containing protein, partial [Aphelenchoides avenae]
DSFFRIENGFYQYIHARHAGMMFTEEEEAAFESAWKISRAQIRQLIDRISSFLPFDTQQMVKLHEQRQLLRHLTQPLVEAQEQIERTKKEIERHNADLRTLDKGISDYKAKLYTPVDKWEEQRVNRPQTVCENCKRMVDGRVVFDRVCHYDCQISHVTEYQPGHPSLQYCATFDCGKSERCNEPWCGHTLGSHMHIPFIYRKYTAKVIDDNVQQMLNGKYSKKQVVEAQIRTNEKVSKQLDSEMSVIRKINLELVGEIGGASIDPFSDATEKYLETCISNAESQNDKKALERHQQELQEHRQMRNLYVQSLESGGNGNTVDVEKAVQELFGLEHLGQFIKRSYQKYLDAEKEKATYAQVRFEPSKGLGDLLRNLGWRTPSADSEPAIVHRMRPVLDEPTETNV